MALGYKFPAQKNISKKFFKDLPCNTHLITKKIVLVFLLLGAKLILETGVDKESYKKIVEITNS
jgi:hypothetical protein